jgi:AcrR family transcriptional regulator
MQKTSARQRPLIDRSRSAVLDAVISVLIDHPEASLSEISHLVGVGRTTLHRMFPTRADLMVAVAAHAVDNLSTVYVAAGIPDAFTQDASVDSSWGAFRALADALVPLGSQLMFLLRASELDSNDDLARQVAALDSVFEQALRRAQAAGEISARSQATWAMESFYALSYLAWEHVRDGKLASRDAASLILASWRYGITEVNPTG